MAENDMTVQVALRIRPLVPTEVARGCQPCLDTVPKEPQVQVKGTEKAFTYNFVFGPEENQLTFYNTAVQGLIANLFKGYNVTVLAYGQTGSGKTFSMGTTYSAEDESMGIIPRAVCDIFNTIKEMDDWEFKVTVSFMELYKEQLFDLLATNRCMVDIREDGKCIRIPGLTEVPVANPDDTIKCLIQGSSCRATGATAMNAQSSRSHAIFTINIYQQKKDAENVSLSAKFHLVDLAGSERSKKTKATGERFKEGVNINRGLLALGNVISALGEEGHQKSYISYRDSKLTRLLQDSLGGNSITLMIACVSPADYNLDETLSTLRYADRARKIKNKPIINQDPKAVEISKLKQQIQELRLELLARGGGGGVGTCPPEHLTLEKENTSLIAKNRNLTEELNNALSASTNLFERALMAEVARDRMKVKLCELQAEFDHTLDSLSHTIDQENCPATFLEQLKNLRDLQLKIQDLQAEQKRSSDEMLNHELASGMSPKQSQEQENEDPDENIARTEFDIDEHHETHTLQQAERNKELQEINKKLALKEELASKLLANMTHMSSIKTDYENNLQDLQQQIETLQKERDELAKVLQNVQNQNNACKKSEQQRKRFQELEQKITALSKKLTEQEKIIKMKEKNDEKINQLNNEIQGMKQIKVKLIRQMRSENERFRTWKQQREKELMKLRMQDRKRQNEMARMERLHTKQQNVLKRKVEEAVAVNKRLKDALAVQKSVQERRALQHGNTTKVQLWIDQELEVLVRTVEAEKTLEQLLDDRSMLHEQLDQLQARFEESGDDKLAIDEEIKQLKEDLELRNAQIADLQQKIMDSDQDNKAKTRWDTVQSMGEAKSALKHLFDLAADIKRDAFNKDTKCEELEGAYEKAVAKMQQYEQQLKDVATSHHQEITKMEREHQEKVLVLLKQLHGREGQETGDSILAERLRIQSQELEKLEMMQKEHEEMRQEIESLKAQLKTPRKGKKKRSEPKKILVTDFEASPLMTEEEEEDDSTRDPDWQKTPIFKKLQKLKSERFSVRNEPERVAVKRGSDGQIKCTCKTACKNKQCGCKKNNTSCTTDCRCNQDECQNRMDVTKTLFEDSSGESLDDENKDPSEDNFKRPSVGLEPLSATVESDICMILISQQPDILSLSTSLPHIS